MDPPTLESRRGAVALLACLGALIAALLGLASRAEALVYWADGERDAISRAALNGAGPHNFIHGVQGPCGVAVNSTHVFWVDQRSNGTWIGRAGADGSGVNRNFIPVTGAGADSACGVDVNGSHISWARGDTVGRANLNGTGINQALIPAQGSNTCGVAVSNSALYYGLATSNRIGAAQLDGGGASPNFITDVGIVCGVAVTSPATHLYWASIGFTSIGRATTLATDQDPIFIDTGFDDPCDVETNATHVYWTQDTGVARANLNGSGVNQQLITTGGTCGIALDTKSIPGTTLGLGKKQLLKKKGVALVTAIVSWPGKLVVGGKGVKKAVRKVAAPGKVKLRVRARGKARRKLRRTGRVRVKARITQFPAGGSKQTRTRRIKLIKRR